MALQRHTRTQTFTHGRTSMYLAAPTPMTSCPPRHTRVQPSVTRQVRQSHAGAGEAARLPDPHGRALTWLHACVGVTPATHHPSTSSPLCA